MKFLNRSSTAPAPRAGLSRRLLTTGALFCIGIMPLSACSLFNPPLERDESVHAIFDAEQDIVKMPLDDYSHYEGGTHYEYTAFKIAMKQCYAEHGQSYTDPDQAPQSESAPSGDPGRKYGPWNVEYAQKYGFQKRDPNAAPISFSSPESLSPEEQLRTECHDKARETLEAAVPEGKRLENDVQSTYSRISTDAGNAVYGSKLHRELEEKWKQCVSDRGLTPNKAGYVAEESPLNEQLSKNGGYNEPASEEEIRIATIMAECNQQVGMSQQLYDLEAQYQMPLIRKYQSQLEQDRKAERERDEKFKQYVLEHQ
ncbi:multidrug transporter [Rothia mucilaginosa]|uniref:multidrug transporter n=1 Tax=Rothia mucilaginosa TaxID=43675 RepID=UPI0028E54449|nr:multidrug transporter [Rothia mucilaginosa]